MRSNTALSQKLNSSQMASAGVAHLAYRGSFSQKALNWIGNQPESVDFRESALQRNKADVAAE